MFRNLSVFNNIDNIENNNTNNNNNEGVNTNNEEIIIENSEINNCFLDNSFIDNNFNSKKELKKMLDDTINNINDIIDEEKNNYNESINDNKKEQLSENNVYDIVQPYSSYICQEKQKNKGDTVGATDSIRTHNLLDFDNNSSDCNSENIVFHKNNFLFNEGVTDEATRCKKKNKIISEISPLIIGFYSLLYSQIKLTKCFTFCNFNSNLNSYNLCKYDAFSLYILYSFLYKNYIINITYIDYKYKYIITNKNNILYPFFKYVKYWDVFHLNLNILYGYTFPKEYYSFLFFNTSLQLFNKLNNLYDLRILNKKLNISKSKKTWKFKYSDIVYSIIGFSIGSCFSYYMLYNNLLVI